MPTCIKDPSSGLCMVHYSCQQAKTYHLTLPFLLEMTQISNLKVIGLMVDFLKIVKLWHLSTEFYGVGQLFATHYRTQYLNTKV